MNRAENKGSIEWLAILDSTEFFMITIIEFPTPCPALEMGIDAAAATEPETTLESRPWKMTGEDASSKSSLVERVILAVFVFIACGILIAGALEGFHLVQPRELCISKLAGEPDLTCLRRIRTIAR